MIQESKFKSSIDFKEIINDYLLNVENNFIPKENFSYMNTVIMKYEDINNLFKETYKMYSFTGRINKIEKELISALKKSSSKLIEKLEKERTEKIQGLVGKKHVEVYEEYEKMIKILQKDVKKIVKKYLNKISKKDCIQLYKDFIQNYITDSNNLFSYLKSNTLSNLSKGEISFEDLAPLMYIQIKVFGIKEKCKIKHVVIDEAQDYGEFQYYHLI